MSRDRNPVKSEWTLRYLLLMRRESVCAEPWCVCVRVCVRATSGFVLQAVAQLRGGPGPCRRVWGSDSGSVLVGHRSPVLEAAE